MARSARSTGACRPSARPTACEPRRPGARARPGLARDRRSSRPVRARHEPRATRVGVCELSFGGSGFGGSGFGELSYAQLGFDDLGFGELSFAELSFAQLGFDDLGFDDLGFDDLGFVRPKPR
jgi:hypothetical protein